MSRYPSNWLPEWCAAAEADEHAFGVHWAMARAGGCLKRAHLPGDSDGGADADYGTSVHTWMHAYHGNEALPLLDSVAPARSCSEMELVSRYAARYSRASLGKTLLAEQRLYGTLAINGRVYPIAGSLDRVSDFDANAAYTFTSERNGVSLDEGIYLHDYKTKKSNSELTVPVLMNGEQAPLYIELIRQNYPEWASRLRGTLFHIMYRYVKDREDSSQFQTVSVGLPTDDDMLRLKSLIVDAWHRLETYGASHMSPTRCFDWSRECPAFIGCSRSNLTQGEA